MRPVTSFAFVALRHAIGARFSNFSARGIPPGLRNCPASRTLWGLTTVALTNEGQCHRDRPGAGATADARGPGYGPSQGEPISRRVQRAAGRPRGLASWRKNRFISLKPNASRFYHHGYPCDLVVILAEKRQHLIEGAGTRSRKHNAAARPPLRFFWEREGHGVQLIPGSPCRPGRKLNRPLKRTGAKAPSRGSSVVERPALDRLDAGSSPALSILRPDLHLACVGSARRIVGSDAPVFFAGTKARNQPTY